MSNGEPRPCATIPSFGQQWGQPTCFFQEHLERRKTPGCWSHPEACHRWVAAPPQPSQPWQTPTPRSAGNFHPDPEPTVKKSVSRSPTSEHQPTFWNLIGFIFPASASNHLCPMNIKVLGMFHFKHYSLLYFYRAPLHRFVEASSKKKKSVLC